MEGLNAAWGNEAGTVRSLCDGMKVLGTPPRTLTDMVLGPFETKGEIDQAAIWIPELRERCRVVKGLTLSVGVVATTIDETIEIVRTAAVWGIRHFEIDVTNYLWKKIGNAQRASPEPIRSVNELLTGVVMAMSPSRGFKYSLKIPPLDEYSAAEVCKLIMWHGIEAVVATAPALSGKLLSIRQAHDVSLMRHAARISETRRTIVILRNEIDVSFAAVGIIAAANIATYKEAQEFLYAGADGVQLGSVIQSKDGDKILDVFSERLQR